jgi:hypothetical protein
LSLRERSDEAIQLEFQSNQTSSDHAIPHARQVPPGLLRRFAPVNELTLFVIAKEPWRLRQSTGAIDQLDRHVASLLAMTIAKNGLLL